MYKLATKIKELKQKIYIKQRDLMEKMCNENVKLDNKAIKNQTNEINLLEEILDIRIDEYHNLNNEFWKN